MLARFILIEVGHLHFLKVGMSLSNVLLLLHASPIQLTHFILGCPSMTVPSHFVLLSRLLEDSESVEIFDCDEWLLEVVSLEVVEVAEAEYLLLLKLPHQDLLHLLVGQLAVVVEPHGLDVAIVIFLQFHLVFDHLDTRLEDAFVFDRLSNLNLTSPRP